MKKIFLVFLLVFFFLFSSCITKENSNNTKILIINNSIKKLKVCPDKWYENKMPQIISENQTIVKREYFIIDGKREEISNYDLIWIKKNCKVNLSMKVY